MNAPSSITRLMLVDAVVVAGDRPCPDVDVGTDNRIAQIGQMIGPSDLGPRLVFFNSTKLPILAFHQPWCLDADARMDQAPLHLQLVRRKSGRSC